MLEDDGKYLTIGSVVLLKGAKKKVMVTGFLSVSPETGEKIFDYSVCPYPEGFLNYNQVCVFNHDQIDKVYFKGYVNEEEIIFKRKLKDSLEKTPLEDLSKKHENNE